MHWFQCFTGSVIPSEKKFFGCVLTSFAPHQFLEWIITTNETWVYHYELESKTQNMAWKCLTSPMAKKFKSQPSAGKIMLTIFWDMKGAVWVHFTPKAETVNSQECCDELQTKLKLTIRSRHHEKLQKDVILLHNNACPPMANQTVKTVSWDLNWWSTCHPVQISPPAISICLAQWKKF